MVFDNTQKQVAALCRVLIAVLLAVSGLYAHGLGVGVEVTEDLVILSCRYADGTFPDAEALVYSPEQPDKTFQIGRTDSAGIFSFVPNANGKWHVVIDDGMGHRKAVDVSVDGSSFAIPESSSPTILRLAFGAFFLAASGFLIGRISRKQKAPRASTVEGA
jgi:hypothetical protein